MSSCSPCGNNESGEKSLQEWTSCARTLWQKCEGSKPENAKSEARGRQLPMGSIMGQVARERCLATTSENCELS